MDKVRQISTVYVFFFLLVVSSFVACVTVYTPSASRCPFLSLSLAWTRSPCLRLMMCLWVLSFMMHHVTTPPPPLQCCDYLQSF